ncbi:hypothetical protein [Streptomyces sp. NBC_01483]|uniref:hypothetical protein n=1 Tax=Streptomyces sp. NBC_01483 TaxID=2903883 RepID=UPI002E330A38|nr:hypothetical protein [Streptomyces sp. NBC_01483]
MEEFVHVGVAVHGPCDGRGRAAYVDEGDRACAPLDEAVPQRLLHGQQCVVSDKRVYVVAEHAVSKQASQALELAARALCYVRSQVVVGNQ